MKLALRKKTFAMKKSYFQSIISLHVLKLAFNKSMRASDDEQSIRKLWPYEFYKNFHEECSLVYLANHIKLLRTAAFNLCITNYHVSKEL